MFNIGKYILNVLVGIDQLANTIVGGDPDETLSSRFYKWRLEPKDSFRYKAGHFMCRLLHWFDKDHCDKVVELDEGKDAVIRRINESQ